MNAPSIRLRLLLFLIVSALLLASGATAVTYWVALDRANEAYDRSLLDPAFDIADHLRVDAAGAHIDLPRKALEALVFDQSDKVVFQVRSPTNSIVDGVNDLPRPVSVVAGAHAFFDGHYQGEQVRLVALGTPSGFVIQVGETLHKRARLVSDILLADLVPTFLIALASIAFAWVGVSRGLIPLERLCTNLMRRAPEDLRLIEDNAAPVEIVPVIKAFNRLLAHLREASTLQQRFLANAAHQLRTPLAGLQMHLELLFRQALPASLRTDLERMHDATVRASRLANQLLVLASVESAQESARELAIIDLQAVVEVAAREWVPRAYARQIDLGFVLERVAILGDPRLLPELLNNLIDNALRYTPAGGTVTVRIGREAETSYLIVEDTGPGIPLEERSKVRERFYRIAESPGEGSGLGLAIVQEVVDCHNGVLEIGASGAAAGTRVRVSFPQTGNGQVSQ